MKEKKKKPVDDNFIKSVSYDLAGEIGIVDNEEMQNNKYLNSDEKKIEESTRSHQRKPRK